MSRMRPARRLTATALLAALVLAGCGFAPRGALKLPAGFGPLAVSAADPYSPLAEGLRRDLSRAGVAVSEAGDGGARLAILEERWETRPISVDAFVAVREVETRYTVVFDLVDATGAKRLDGARVELARDYVYEAAESFGNPGEQEIIQQELRRDMQAALLRRIDIALRDD
ncbi:MAG: LPS assembly lipoprotein LptE [Silanimonas lenta]